jgi:serine/threonine-protein kinase ATR
MQEKHQDDMAALVQQYQHLVLDKYQPCFHRWFIERFIDPTAWLESRLTFTRSCAVWAAVGHVVGLGDRHTENVLLDTTNGECVHVDFDCLFDKGLQLARPEIVPFRLTPNLVDAMGLTGVEGVFRRTMEVSMSLLRENKETLLSVLEPFLRDPTVAWGRGGRAQRQEATMVAPLPKGSGIGAATHKTAEQSVIVEAENPEVKEALEKITGRLNGIYNLTNPAAERIHRRYLQRNQPLPAFGMGAGRDEAQSLSVQGQVARLIDEAKAVENLAQMYIGWTPWQ